MKSYISDFSQGSKNAIKYRFFEGIKNVVLIVLNDKW